LKPCIRRKFKEIYDNLQFMLHYLKTLQDWFDPAQWEKLPIARAAASFLQDLHHDPAIIEMKPQHIAIACINLALQCYGAQVPLVEEEESVTWYSVCDFQMGILEILILK